MRIADIMPAMNLTHLRSFVHVAELGSLSLAAERLHLSQPALSRQIQLLEEQLDVKLLHRTGRGVVPTEAGERLRDSAYDIFEAIAKVEREVAGTGSVAGRLSVGLPPSASTTMAGELVESYRARYPAVSLQIVEDLTGAIQDGLLEGRLDLGILYEGAISPGLQTEQLRIEALELIGPPAADLSQDCPVRFETLAQLPMILPGYRHGLRAIVEQSAFRAGVRLHTVIEADSLRLLLDFVYRGLGYTVLSREVCGPLLARGELTAAPIVEPPLRRAWVLAWRKEFSLSAAAQAMAGMIREVVAASGAALGAGKQ